MRARTFLPRYMISLADAISWVGVADTRPALKQYWVEG